MLARLITSLAATLLLVAAAASVAFGHGGHPHAVYGPPAPDSLWPGAPAAHDALEQARFQQQLADAPVEVDGTCATTASFDGIGRGCRTEDGLLRVELAGGGEMLTHGPDFVGAASDLTPSTTTPTIVAAVQNASKSDVSCVPTSEAHTQLVYAIPADGVDQSATKSAAFRQSTYEASAVIDNTSRLLSATAGRRLRVACDGAGDATVLTMRLPRRAAASNFSSVRTDVEAEYAKLSNVGSATKVRYLVYYDAHLDGFSGVGSLYSDTTAGATNNNNLAEAMAVQDNSNGDGPDWYVLLHEISHNMGAVQDGAPDSNEVSHCNDGLDVMCYAEPGTGGVSGTYTTTTCVELRYDCDSDSYFHPAPTTPWLQANWNVAATYNRYLDAYTATADTTAPATPTGLAGIGHGDFIRLTWNPVADSDLHTYRIERDTGGGVWRTVGDAWLGETTFDATWSGIAANTSYSLRIRAYDERGRTSAESPPILVDTGATDADSVTVGGPALAAPINAVVESTTAGSITLRWEAPQMSGATGWEVDKEWGTDWWRSQYGFGSASGSVTFDRDVYNALLLPDTRYQYRIRLTDDWGRTSASVTVAGWTKTAPDVTAPSAPGSLQVASSAGTTPTLTWATAAEAVDYVVSRESTPGSGTWSQLAIVTSPTYTVSGLTHGTTHSLSVQARDEAGNVSNRSTTSFVAPAAGDMSAPTAPTISGTSFSITHTTIGYSWSAATDDVGVIGYRMLYRPSSTQDYQLGPTTAGTSGTITGLVPGTDYVVIVEAYDAAGHATMSGGYVPRTTADTTAPTQPSSLTASAHTSTSIQLDWGASTDGGSGVTGYRVYRTNPGGEQLLTTTAAGVRTYTPTGLTPDTSYTFAVEAIDAAANASARSTITSSTSPAPDPTPPSTPATFTQGPGPLTETTAPVQWTAATDNVAVAGYDIHRTAPTASGAPVASVGAVTSTTLAGLSPATAYTFEIAARDAAGNVSPTRQALSFTTPDLTAPGAPGNFRSSGTTASGTTLDWEASTDNVAVTHYRVERVLPTSGVLTTTTNLSYAVSGLDQATTYRFRVFAIDAAGLEGSSTIDVSTPDITAPTAPTSFTNGTLTETSAPVSWSGASDNVAVIGYRVYRMTPSPSGTPVATPAGNVSTATLTSLLPGTAYTFEIASIDAAGLESSPRRSLSFMTPDITPPSTPGTPAATNNDGDGVTLTWTGSTDNVAVTGYRIEQVAPTSSTVGTVAGLTHDVAGLDDGTSYTFRVYALDAAGNETASADLVVVTVDVSAPGQPGAVTIGTRTSTSIELTWGASTDNVAVTGYRIHQGTTTADALVASPSGTTHVVSGLLPMTSYTFAIVARDAATNTSAVRSVTTSTIDSVAPAAPSNLRTTSRSGSSITLAWDEPVDDVLTTGYRVYEDVAGVDTLVATVTSGTTYTVSALADATDYTFRIEAYDASANTSTRASHTTYTSDTQAPTQPGALQLGTVTGTSIAFSWTASTDARSPITYELRDGSATGTILASTTSLGATITGLDDGVTHHVFLVAHDPSNNTSPARDLQVATPDITDPNAPTNLVASNVGGTTFDLDWTHATDNVGVDHYRVLVDDVEVASPSLNEVTVSGRDDATTHGVDVIAVDAAGRESAATSIDVTTLDATAPGAPGAFAAGAATDTSISMTWTLATDNVAVTGYRIYQMSPGTPDTLVASPSALATSATVSGLTASTSYTFEIAARDARGLESTRASVSRSTLAAPDLTPPTQPSFLPAGNVTTGGMRLAWTASTDLGGIAGYDLERLIGATWTLVTPRTPLLQFDITGLAPGTSHSFRVRAIDASGNASTYATTSVATDAGPDLAAPAIPSGPVTSAADTSGTVTLTWGASTDDRGIVAGYRVSLLTGAGYILQTVATTNTVILTGQPIGTTATYAIAAIDPAGNTSTALVTTVAIPAPAPPPPPPPEPPAAAVPASAFAATVTSTQITLSWQQGGTATTGWRIVEIRSGAVASTRDVTSPTSRYGPYAPNTSVRFELYSLAGGATSSAVTLDVKTAADTVKPTKPGRFRVVSPARGTFALTWTRSRDDVRLRGYEVKLSTRGVKPKVVKLGATALKAKVVKLRPRAPYVVQIRAVDMAGNASVWVTVRLRTR